MMGLKEIVVVLALALLAGPLGCEGTLGRCQPDLQAGCQWKDYFIFDILLLSGLAAGVILAAFLVFLCPWYFCARYCCKCCGASSNRQGCCCTRNVPAKYTVGAIIRAKLFPVVLLLIAAAGVGIALYGNNKMRDGWDQVFNSVRNVNNYLMARAADIASGVQSISSSLPSSASSLVNIDWRSINDTESKISSSIRLAISDALGSTSYSSSYINDVRTAVNNGGDWVQMVKDAVQKVETNRWIGVIVLVCVGAGLVLLGVLSALLNIRKCLPLLILCAIFPIGTIMWLSFAIHGLGSSLMRDVCQTVSYLTVQTAPGAQSELFVQINKQFTPASSLISDIATQVSGAACTALLASGGPCAARIGPSNNLKVFNCSALSCSTYADALNALTTGVVATINGLCGSSGASCTAAQCAAV
eukprot:RCo016979